MHAYSHRATCRQHAERLRRAPCCTAEESDRTPLALKRISCSCNRRAAKRLLNALAARLVGDRADLECPRPSERRTWMKLIKHFEQYLCHGLADARSNLRAVRAVAPTSSKNIWPIRLMIIFVYPVLGVFSILVQYCFIVARAVSAQEARPVADVDDHGVHLRHIHRHRRRCPAGDRARELAPAVRAHRRAAKARLRPDRQQSATKLPCTAHAVAARLGHLAVANKERRHDPANAAPIPPQPCRSATSPG